MKITNQRFEQLVAKVDLEALEIRRVRDRHDRLVAAVETELAALRLQLSTVKADVEALYIRTARPPVAPAGRSGDPYD
jgi:hypothetical protein